MKRAGYFTKLKSYFIPLSRIERVDSVKTYGFSRRRYNFRDDIGKLYICPMESGKKAIIRLANVRIWESHDEGYSLDWEFMRYI